MNKIGILTDKLSGTDLAHRLIVSINNFLEKNPDSDVIAFVENQSKPVETPHFAVMNVSECYEFDGIVIATSLSTAEKLLRMPGPTRKIVYLWDLWWVGDGRYFEEYQRVYGNESLELVVRNDFHRKVMLNVWNRPDIKVVSDFEIERLFTDVSKE